MHFHLSIKDQAALQFIGIRGKLRSERYIIEDMGDLKSSTDFVDPEIKSGFMKPNFSGHDEEQPDILIDRQVGGNSLVLIAEMPDVAHGTLSPEGDPATLIVLKFKFLPNEIDRRFRSAHITVTFLDADANSKDLAPTVQDIAPDGAWSLLPFKKHIEVTTTGSVGGVIGPPGITINTGMQYQYKMIEDKDNCAKLFGTTRVLGRTWGPKNAVTWTLLENTDTKSGIPTWLQGAILLKRNPSPDKAGQKFQATVEIEVDVDWKSRVGGRARKTLVDKLVTFDPAMEAKCKDWMLDDLGREDLKALQKVIDLMPVNGPDTPVNGSI
jgi:hypothetical protein